MSATIHHLPPTVALSQEPMPVTLATNQVTNARALLTIRLTEQATGPQANQLWDITFSGKKISFIFKYNPDQSGLQLPIPSSLGITQRYVHQLAEAISRHEWISDQFETIVDSANFKIILRSRFDAPLSIESYATVNHLTAYATNAASPYLKSNLCALLKVVSRKGREFAKLSGSYRIEKNDTGAYEGRSEFDISGLFDLAPHLPDELSFDPDFAFQYGIAFKAYAQYFLRFADKYGSVPVAESLLRSSPAYVLFGGRMATSILDFQMDNNGIYWCHPSKKITQTKHQPSWVYFFTTERLIDVTVKLRLITDDVVNNTFDIFQGATHDVKANRLYYYRSGYEQLRGNRVAEFYNIPNVVAYEWRLVDLNGKVILKQRYDFEPCRYDSLYLAFANGLGGIDTLHVKGGYNVKTEAERTIVTHTDVATVNDMRQGAIASMDATIQPIYDIQTGLITPQYAQQLQQILVGDVWIIDTQNNRFLKVIADTKSIEVRPKNNGMVSLSMAFKMAWLDRNAV
jgi:hypothetical protein